MARPLFSASNFITCVQAFRPCVKPPRFPCRLKSTRPLPNCSQSRAFFTTPRLRARYKTIEEQRAHFRMGVRGPSMNTDEPKIPLRACFILSKGRSLTHISLSHSRREHSSSLAEEDFSGISSTRRSAWRGNGYERPQRVLESRG